MLCEWSCWGVRLVTCPDGRKTYESITSGNSILQQSGSENSAGLKRGEDERRQLARGRACPRLLNLYFALADYVQICKVL